MSGEVAGGVSERRKHLWHCGVDVVENSAEMTSGMTTGMLKEEIKISATPQSYYIYHS